MPSKGHQRIHILPPLRPTHNSPEDRRTYITQWACWHRIMMFSAGCTYADLNVSQTPVYTEKETGGNHTVQNKSCLHTMEQMLAGKCRPLSHLKFKEKCISAWALLSMLTAEETREKMQEEDGRHILYLFPSVPPPSTPPQRVRSALPIMSSQIWPWASPLSPRIFTHTVTSDHFSVLNKNNTTTASQWCITAHQLH